MKKLRALGRSALYGIIYMLAVAFLFYNTLQNPAATAVSKPTAVSDNPILIIGAILIIMICPLWVDRMYRAGRMREGSRWLMVIAYIFTISIVGFSAISWYLTPDNSRWEPLTIILGFTASWITLLQSNWREEDRILNIFHLDNN